MSDSNIVTAIENITEYLEGMKVLLFLIFFIICFAFMTYCFQGLFKKE